ncbi:hypothetical protein [Bacillus piscicola]|uniref:hypothetical protein n=1 Tax=Bacillus piscicola TaxID=1632684 RepID=UPI001F09801C|nr:hypothetical protein [Bacillus piscicola]
MGHVKVEQNDEHERLLERINMLEQRIQAIEMNKEQDIISLLKISYQKNKM